MGLSYYYVSTISGAESVLEELPQSLRKLYKYVDTNLIYTGRIHFVAEFEYRQPMDIFFTPDKKIAGSNQIGKDPTMIYGPLVALIKRFIIRVKGASKERVLLRIGTYKNPYNVDKTDEDLLPPYSKWDMSDYLVSGKDFFVYDRVELPTDIITDVGGTFKIEIDEEMDKDAIYIIYNRPDLLYDRYLKKFNGDILAIGEESTDYIDPRNCKNSYLKFFLFDPIKIEVRTLMSESIKERLETLITESSRGVQINQNLENRRIEKIEEGYVAPYEFEKFENDPIILRDYWLTERVNYLNQFYEGNLNTVDRDGFYFPAPLETYLRHYREDKSDFELTSYNLETPTVDGRANAPFPKTMAKSEDVETNIIQAAQLQELRWVLFYSYQKEEVTDNKFRRHFGRSIEYTEGDNKASIWKWDGELSPLMSRILPGTTTLRYFREAPEVSEVSVKNFNKKIRICVGCNKHRTWGFPYEFGFNTFANQENLIPIDDEVCPYQMPIGQIDKANPRRYIVNNNEFDSATEYGTLIGGRPKFPSLIKDQHFNRFVDIFIGVDHLAIWGLSINPLPDMRFQGTFRIVPEMTKILRIAPPKKCESHLEVCSRVYSKGKTRNEENGKILSECEVTGPGKRIFFDVIEIDWPGYPYNIRSKKTYAEQLAEAGAVSNWNELSMVKAFIKPTKEKFMGKRGFKSMEKPWYTEIFCVEQTNYNPGSGECNQAEPIESPGGPPGCGGGYANPASIVFTPKCDQAVPRHCGPFLWGWTYCYGPCNIKWHWNDFRCAYWQCPGYNSKTTAFSQTLHFFAPWVAQPFPEYAENNTFLCNVFGICYPPRWDMYTDDRATSLASVPTTQVNWSVTRRGVDNSCSPGMRGFGGANPKSTSGSTQVLMTYMTREDAVDLINSLLQNPGNKWPTPEHPEVKHPIYPDMATPSLILSEYNAFVTYGNITFSVGSEDLSQGAYQFSSASQQCCRPTGWDMFCYSANPGPGLDPESIEGDPSKPNSQDAFCFLSALKDGKKYFTAQSTHAPPHSHEFVQSWWFRHWWRFVDGIWQKPA